MVASIRRTRLINKINIQIEQLPRPASLKANPIERMLFRLRQFTRLTILPLLLNQPTFATCSIAAK